jgi:hypothetical protein
MEEKIAMKTMGALCLIIILDALSLPGNAQPATSYLQINERANYMTDQQYELSKAGPQQCLDKMAASFTKA